MSSQEGFASASICSRSAIKASADSPCGDDSPPEELYQFHRKSIRGSRNRHRAYFVSAYARESDGVV
jgi:hypothetical protein